MKRTDRPRPQGRPPISKRPLYCLPMSVAEIHVFPRCHGTPSYPVCPRCRGTMESEYGAFCGRCGQRLDWGRYKEAKVVYVEPDGGPAEDSAGRRP